ncbi:hypothetical protein YB2330_002133 [Saitoella coloradoensis]
MSAPVVAEFSSVLEGLLAMKAPGVSGTKIGTLTQIAVQHIKEAPGIINALTIHLRRTPGTHKLGSLYVVDSVARAYQDFARKSPADEHAFLAGLNLIADNIYNIMNDAVQAAPEKDKEKIRKLVDIWEKAATFSPEVLNAIRSQSFGGSTTPPGPPPAHLAQAAPTAAPVIPQASALAPAATPVPNAQNTDAASVLAMLANIAKQNTAAAAPAAAPAPIVPLPPIQAPTPAAPQPTASADPRFNMIPTVQHAAPANVPLPAPSAQPIPAAMAGLDPQQLALLQLLSTQPQLAATLLQNAGGAAPANPVAMPWQQPASSGPGPRDDALRSRSRSPGYRGGPRDRSPARRGRSPSYDNYGRRAGARDRSPMGRRSRSRSPPRRRSPPGYGRERSPQRNTGGGPPDQPKNTKGHLVQPDPTISPSEIKVLSRTLFVGGLTHSVSESELRDLFGRYGAVQSVICNHDKRHAFVKLYQRPNAEAAKSAMEVYQHGDTTLRTRWGVGFGPRDCSDYATGVSVIPLGRLTDADRRWLQSAEYGGTGGKPITGGIIVEEPDIEIGAGVSSKAISKKMPTRRDRDREFEPERRDRDYGAPRREEPYGGARDMGAMMQQGGVMPWMMPQNGGFPGQAPPGYPQAFPPAPGAGGYPGYGYPGQPDQQGGAPWQQ